MNLEEKLWNFFQTAVDRPHYELVAHAKENFGIVLRYLMLEHGVRTSAELILPMMATFLAADGKLTTEECSFLEDIVHGELDYNGIMAVCEQVASDFDYVEVIDEWIDNAPESVKNAFVMLGLDLIACDGEITPEEKALLLKYLI